MPEVVSSIEYRGKRILSITSRLDGPNNGYCLESMELEGVSWVVDAEGNCLTPVVKCSYQSACSGADFDTFERMHQGWLLLGDFIFLTDNGQLSLWVENSSFIKKHKYKINPPVSAIENLEENNVGLFDPKDPATNPNIHNQAQPAGILLSQSLFLSFVHDYRNFYGETVSSVRFIDTDGDLSPNGIDKRAWSIVCGNPPYTGPLDAIGGAARVFIDRYGWRWLFPHDSGAADALALLKSTNHKDDLERLLPILQAAAPWEKNLAEAHFRVAVKGIATDPTSNDRGLKLENSVGLPDIFPDLLQLIEQVFCTN